MESKSILPLRKVKMSKTRVISEEEIEMQQAYAVQVQQMITGRGLKAHIRTYGCQQNEADSERLSGMALSMGYTLTDDEQQADLIVVNTCAVREHAELKALSITGQFKHLKAKNPSMLIGVCGCMVSQEHRKEDIKNRYPYVDFLLVSACCIAFRNLYIGSFAKRAGIFIWMITLAMLPNGCHVHPGKHHSNGLGKHYVTAATITVHIA